MPAICRDVSVIPVLRRSRVCSFDIDQLFGHNLLGRLSLLGRQRRVDITSNNLRFLRLFLLPQKLVILLLVDLVL